MTADVDAHPLWDGHGFLVAATAHSQFCATGSVSGRIGHVAWAVVDPQRHALSVWTARSRRPGSYLRTARGLDAVVVTNGPMVGKRLSSGRKVTRSWLPAEFALHGTVGLIAGCAAGIAGFRRRAGVHGAVAGAAIGVAVAAVRCFNEWVPCGIVRGAEAKIDDRRDFDGEGVRHAWFGRTTGNGFNAYGIGDGNPPANIAEGMGGLILLVKDHRVVDCSPGDRNYRRDFAELGRKSGVVAWGLVPGDGDRPDSGVLTVLGSRRIDAATAARALVAMGARDAVATDQRGSVLMASHRALLLRPPNLPRQSMQVYGLCCR